jgi:hypothetical protein
LRDLPIRSARALAMRCVNAKRPASASS